MESLLMRAIFADISLATPNAYGTPTIRMEESLTISFFQGYIDVCQGINLVVRVDHINKQYLTKYTNIGIVRKAEDILNIQGYTKVV